MKELLPLEKMSLLTEINKEVNFWGWHCIVFEKSGVNVRLSVYEILSRIYVVFGEVDIPFYILWQNTEEYARAWALHYKENISQ